MICPHYKQGRCTWGNHCRYAHPTGEGFVDVRVTKSVMMSHQIFGLAHSICCGSATPLKTLLNGSNQCGVCRYHLSGEPCAYNHICSFTHFRSPVKLSSLPDTSMVVAINTLSVRLWLCTHAVSSVLMANGRSLYIDINSRRIACAFLRSKEDVHRVLDTVPVRYKGNLLWLAAHQDVFWSTIHYYQRDGLQGLVEWQDAIEKAHRALSFSCLYGNSCPVDECPCLHPAVDDLHWSSHHPAESG